MRKALSRLAGLSALGLDAVLGFALAVGLASSSKATISGDVLKEPESAATVEQQPRPPAAEIAPAAPLLASNVTVVRAAEREVVERAIVTGTLVPHEEILIVPEIEGQRVTEVLVEEGDRVKQGQVLARLTRDVIET
jgi:HlyD family secretion protein